MTIKYDPIFIAIPEGKRTSESVCGRGVDSAAQPWTSHDESQKNLDIWKSLVNIGSTLVMLAIVELASTAQTVRRTKRGKHTGGR